jgi:ABC-type transport system involved in multi-copper enzyme maturation permease subunit
MSKAWQIARRLLWQNRWLFLLLMLWPYCMTAILLAEGAPDPDDVLWMLHQECFAGLALVAVIGSTLLGNEQRSRRILTVLARAVSRPQYLFSLWLAAWLPLLLYGSGFVISGVILGNAIHRPFTGVFIMTLMQIVLGVWAGAVSIFWSVLLPQIVASMVSVAWIGLAAYMGTFGWVGGPGRLLVSLFETSMSTQRLTGKMEMDAILTLVAGGVWLAAASWIFSRRDLNLTAE